MGYATVFGPGIRISCTGSPTSACAAFIKESRIWSFYILESADTNAFEGRKVWLCIRARLQSCRSALKQCWALAPAVFSWPSSATGREKLLSNLVFRAGLATAGAKTRILLACEGTTLVVP